MALHIIIIILFVPGSAARFITLSGKEKNNHGLNNSRVVDFHACVYDRGVLMFHLIDISVGIVIGLIIMGIYFDSVERR